MKRVILPSRDEMLSRLGKVDSNPHLQKNFYPLLLEEAGEEKASGGVAMMVLQAIHRYAADMPPLMGQLLLVQAPQFIEALVKDPEAAAEAKGFLRGAISAAK